MNSPARLRIVPEPDIAQESKRVGDEMRDLFAREDALRAELAQVQAQQREARNLYSAEQGLLVRPSVQALRKVLLP